jgi:hypothetical protein
MPDLRFFSLRFANVVVVVFGSPESPHPAKAHASTTPISAPRLITGAPYPLRVPRGGIPLDVSAKVWKDKTAGDTKLNAAGLIDLEERLASYTDVL